MFKFQREKLFRVLLVALYGAIVIIPFQDCTKGGGTSTFGTTGVGAINPALKNAPVPIEVSLNQLSYMSCPQSGDATESFDPHLYPFYTLKYGAYDNTNLQNSTNFSSYIDGSNVGGVGISAAAMDYLRRSNSHPVSAAIQTYIRSSPYTNTHRIASAIILKDRNPDLLSEFSESLIHLEPITGTTMLNYIGGAQQCAVPPCNGASYSGEGTLKSSYFPSISAAASRALVGVINYGKSEADADKFVSGLNNHFLAIGLVPTINATDAASIVQHLASPDNDVTKRLAARGYTFSFQYGTKAMTGVTEWDLNPSDYTSGTVVPTDLSAKESQSWLCYNAMVVRDIDRKAWFTTTDPGAVSGVNLGQSIGGPTYVYNPKFDPAEIDFVNPTLPFLTPYSQNLIFVNPTEVKNPAYGPLSEYYFKNQFEAEGAIKQIIGNYPARPPNGGNTGFFYACPSENPLTMTSAQLDTLKIVRRFLPAEYFDVNISRNCIVPLKKATSSGSKCYASGDENNNFYIQYINKFNTTSVPPAPDCGPGMNECPAYASFCWRKN